MLLEDECLIGHAGEIAFGCCSTANGGGGAHRPALGVGPNVRQRRHVLDHVRVLRPLGGQIGQIVVEVGVRRCRAGGQVSWRVAIVAVMIVVATVVAAAAGGRAKVVRDVEGSVVGGLVVFAVVGGHDNVRFHFDVLRHVQVQSGGAGHLGVAEPVAIG